MGRYYILDGVTPVECECLLEWARIFTSTNIQVEKTRIGGIVISTVFLGQDHSEGIGKPLLFETIVFGGKYDLGKWQYSTWGAAKKGHFYIVGQVARSRNPILRVWDAITKIYANRQITKKQR